MPDEQYENDKEHTAQLELRDLIQEDAYDEYVHVSCSMLVKGLTSRNTSSTDSRLPALSKQPLPYSFPLSMPGMDVYAHGSTILSTKPIPPPAQVCRDLPTMALQSVVTPPKEACTKLVIHALA
jgi:hypothetical protein